MDETEIYRIAVPLENILEENSFSGRWAIQTIHYQRTMHLREEDGEIAMISRISTGAKDDGNYRSYYSFTINYYGEVRLEFILFKKFEDKKIEKLNYIKENSEGMGNFISRCAENIDSLLKTLIEKN